MKKNVLAAIGLSAMMMNMSCSKEIVTDENQKGLVNVSIEAKEGTESATKVSYDYDSASKYAFSWSDAENIKVFIGSDGYNFTKGDGDRFSGTVEAFENKNVSAVWPSSSVSTLAADATSVSVNVPTAVTVGADNYESSLLVAQTANVADVANLTSLSFHQAMAIVKLQVLDIPSDKSVTKVVIQSNTDNAITKSATVDLTTGVSTPTSYTSELEVNVNDAMAGCNTIVNMALLPTTTASTYTFTVYSDDTVLGSYTTKTATFGRNNIYSVVVDCMYKGVSGLENLSNNLILNVSKQANGKVVNYIDGNSTSYSYNKAYTDLGSDKYIGYYNDAFYKINMGTEMATLLKDGYTFEVIAFNDDLSSPTTEQKPLASTAQGGLGFVYGGSGSNASKMRFCHHDGNKWYTVNADNISENKWFQAIAVWDKENANFKIYLKQERNDAVSSISYSADCPSSLISAKSDGSYVGISDSSNQSGTWNGGVAQCRIWNRVLSESEINSILAQTPDDLFKEDLKKK